jgi:hypothetical protein
VGRWGTFISLLTPCAQEVGAVLGRVLRRLCRDFTRLSEEWPEDGLKVGWAEGVQHRLGLGLEDAGERELSPTP